MTRLEDLESHVRFLTFSCDGRRVLLNSLESRDIVVEQLSLAKAQHQLRIYSWAVMPNHLHLLVQTTRDPEDVTKAMTIFKSRSARRVLALKSDAGASHINRLWLPGGGYDRVVRSGEEFWEKLSYIEQNPVRKGLALRPEDYPWCSSGSLVLPPDHPWW